MAPLQRRPWQYLKQDEARWERLKIGRSQCSIDPAAALFLPLQLRLYWT